MEALEPRDFASPAILLGGPVDYDMYKNFRSQLDGEKKGVLSSPNYQRLAAIRKSRE